MDELKLIALDEEDLKVISAHLQDAVVRSVDVGYVPSARRFAMLARRFNWNRALLAGANERRLAMVRLEHVLSASYKGLQPGAEDQVLNLLAVEFVAGEAPGGTVFLLFSGEAAIRLEVECLEAALADLGAAWETTSKPEHPE